MKTVKFHHLALQGFRSFKRDTVFTFPRRPGFYLLDGDNGAGKSSVWGALAWLLYGKTDRGLKAGDVANWDREELTSVVGEFTVDGTLYGLTRTWSPNSLNLEKADGEPRPVTQEQVDELVGLDFDGFLNTVLISQFATTFFDLDATDRLRLFGEALDLTFWEEKGDLARKEAKGVSEAHDGLKNALEGKRGRLQALREAKARLKAEVEGFRQRRGEKLAHFKGKLFQDGETLALREAKLAKVEARLAKRRERVDRLVALTVKETKAEREAEREVTRLEGELNGALREKTRLEKESEAVGKLTGVCPTCRQSIKTGHTRRVRERLALETGVLDAEINHITDKLRKAKAAVREVSGRLESLATQHDEAEDALRAVKDRNAKLSSGVADLLREIESTRRDLARAKEASPLEEEYAKVKADFVGLSAVVADEQTKVDRLAKRLVALEKLASVFKELRLWIVEEALAELEVEVNNTLLQLGLEGWAVTFEVERETKSGTVSRGFHVLIESPTSPGPVKWKAWSGGETQRLRIAGAVGLAAVIRSRRGLSTPLEIWDEPTTFIQEEGIQDLLTFLQARSREEGRQVWLIDHRSHTFGFDGHVTVEKTEAGSKLVVRKADKA